MQSDKIHLLVTVDQNYMKPLQTMLKSFVVNNTGEAVHVWLLHSGIPQDSLNLLTEYCNMQRMTLTDVLVDAAIFADAPKSKRYPQETGAGACVLAGGAQIHVARRSHGGLHHLHGH